MRKIQGVFLSEDEEVIKKYEASIVGPPSVLGMVKASSVGHLIVTTHRLIFKGETKEDEFLTIRDVSIDKVTGVISYIGKQVNMLRILFSIILFFILTLISIIWGFISSLNHFVSGETSSVHL
jgi:hypothetical protein